MIRDNDMAELVAGMNEFRMDATTQRLCIEQLHCMLCPHNGVLPGTLHHLWGRSPTFLRWGQATPGLFRCIVGAVRAHPTNMTIQLGGCGLLTELITLSPKPNDVPIVTRMLADYTIATLIANVHQNMDSPALARICIGTLRTLVHMHSVTTGVADPPFLMSGVHSIPGFLVTLMHMNQNNEAWVKRSLRCLQVLLVDARLPHNTAGLLAFDVGQAEEYIVAFMALSAPNHKYADGPMLCIDCLRSLYENFPQRVRRPSDVMASVVQQLMAHNQDPGFRNSAVTLMNTIVERFWSPTAPPRRLIDDQIRPCVTQIMPLVVCALRQADANILVNKTQCTTVFGMLSLLCQNNPPQIALAKKMRFAELLHSRYHQPIQDGVGHPVVDARCMAAYHHLEAILAGG
jgi:hypothetical protein